MKTFTKVILITAGSLVAVGLIATGAAAAMGGGITNVFTNQEKYEEVKFDFSDDVNNIVINESSHDIEFKRSDDNLVHVSAHDSDHYKHDVKVEGDTLKIDADSKVEVHIGINIQTKPIKTTVYLPEDQYDKLTIKGSSSDVLLPSGISFDNAEVITSSGDIAFSSNVSTDLKIKASSGDVSLKDCDSKTLSVNTSSGNIVIKDVDDAAMDLVSSSGDVNITNCKFNSVNATTSSGYITLADTTIENTLSLEASSGDISLVRVSADSLNSKTTSGDLDFSELSLTSDSKISTNSGDVFGKGSVAFFVDSDTSSGDVDVNQDKDGVYLKVTTSSGDITIN